jgi:hypothetical protein
MFEQLLRSYIRKLDKHFLHTMYCFRDNYSMKWNPSREADTGSAGQKILTLRTRMVHYHVHKNRPLGLGFKTSTPTY